jgi:hypothetical protein
MVIHIVRFTSALPDGQVHDLFAARADRYAAVSRLQPKYYLRYDNGQHGGVYVWDSRASMEAFRSSELSRTICEVYDVQESSLDVADVVLQLHAEPVRL